MDRFVTGEEEIQHRRLLLLIPGARFRWQWDSGICVPRKLRSQTLYGPPPLDLLERARNPKAAKERCVTFVSIAARTYLSLSQL